MIRWNVSVVLCAGWATTWMSGCVRASPQELGGATTEHTSEGTSGNASSGFAAVCGDGLVQQGEVCDDEASNSDEYAFVARCNAECSGFAPHCGDMLCQSDHESAILCPADCASVCGNAIVEPDEECDDANSDNSDACLNTCKIAICGDGVLHVGMEECDNGPGNANNAECLLNCNIAKCGDFVIHDGFEECDNGLDNANDAACLLNCEIAECGDGFVHEGVEECDDGVNDGDNCSPNCLMPRRVFVTSMKFTGNLGGLYGADDKCRDLAMAAGLNGSQTFKAWLSDSNSSPATRFDTQFEGAYTLVDGTIIANGWEDLTDGQLDHPIDRNESHFPTNSIVWTNTSPYGNLRHPFDHCQEWTSSNAQEDAKVGSSTEVNHAWTDFLQEPCASLRHLYCFEDPNF